MEYQIISNKGDKTTLCIDDEMTVGDVRGISAAMLEAPEDRIMTISLVGKLLVNNEESWGELRTRLFRSQHPHPMQRKLFCNITDRPVTETQSGEVMRMFTSKEDQKEEKEKERQSAEAMESMVDSLSENPGFLESILQMNPQLQKMQKKSPEVARMLKDPETLRTLLKSSINPDRRREMERNAELQLAQISAMPGGQQMINHYMDQMTEDGEEEETENQRQIRIGTGPRLEGEDDVNLPDPGKEANNDPLPNPWASSAAPAATAASSSVSSRGLVNENPFAAMMSGFGGLPGMPGASAQDMGAQPPPMDPATMQMMLQQFMSTAPPGALSLPGAASTTGASTSPASETTALPSLEETMQTGVAALKEMGFEDEAMCRTALQASGGDVEAAVDYIAEHQDDS